MRLVRPEIVLLYPKYPSEHIDKEGHRYRHKRSDNWACYEHKKKNKHYSKALYCFHTAAYKLGR